MSETSDRVRLIICDVLAVDLHEVTDHANFIDDLGADSLDLVDLAANVEAQFDVELDNAELDSAETVGAFVAYVGRVVSESRA